MQTKVHLAKAMVFPVVMCGCESWTIKKAECQRTDGFELWCYEPKTLASPLDCKEIKPVNPKGNQSWIFMEVLMLKLKLQYFGHVMQGVDSFENTVMLGKIKGRRKRGRQRMSWLDGITDLIDISLSKLWEMVKDREIWHVVHGIAKSQTWLSDWPIIARILSVDYNNVTTWNVLVIKTLEIQFQKYSKYVGLEDLPQYSFLITFFLNIRYFKYLGTMDNVFFINTINEIFKIH